MPSSIAQLRLCLGVDLTILLFTKHWDACFDLPTPLPISVWPPVIYTWSCSRWGIKLKLQLTFTSVKEVN